MSYVLRPPAPLRPPGSFQDDLIAFVTEGAPLSESLSHTFVQLFYTSLFRQLPEQVSSKRRDV